MRIYKLWNNACKYCQQARWLILAFFTCTFILWGLWGWREIITWYEDVSPVMEFGQGEAVQLDARPGEVIIFYQSIKKFRNCEGIIQRVMTGPCGHIVISESHSTLPAGFEGRITIPVQIPQEAIPGNCGFQVQARYACNPVDQILQRRQLFISPIIAFTVREYDQ